MVEDVKTCSSFPELIEDLRAAKARNLRLVSAAANPRLGKAVGFTFSDGKTYRLTIARIREFESDAEHYPEIAPLWSFISTLEGRIELYELC